MQEGMGRLVNIIIRTLLSILGAIAGYQLAQYLSGSPWWPKSTLMLDLSMWGLVIVFSAFIGYLLAPSSSVASPESVRYLKDPCKALHGKIYLSPYWD